MSSLALGYVLGLLARREYSEFEIRCKMQEKNFTEQEIEETLLHCQQKNWQNDKRFTENYLYSKSKKGYGLNRIKQELTQLKGIQSETINKAIMESDIDWGNIAFAVLSKKFPSFQEKQDLKSKQKIWRYMLSRGFTKDEFAHFINEEQDDW
ncbi:regulatory protein [Bisgaardia hudsonensis]|uniref:Regulatory protein RecX n=1 Tax=Bisgaardia hudsonensis TaxID=109472 RepID=A0A4R2MUN7_9PAST|nr:recombination regulator RecX [Bisgaardia hudsonensis]QLB13823.1 recombination regulator RecX [Bisgaardia hudsonensis]TCP11693.1 regulatory protein [Bisgaardia hudsonensis]